MPNGDAFRPYLDHIDELSEEIAGWTIKAQTRSLQAINTAKDIINTFHSTTSKSGTGYTYV